MSDEAEHDAAPERDVQMTIWEHLAELRSRLVKVAIAVIAGAVACWTYREALLGVLTAPFLAAWAERFPDRTVVQLQTLAPADAFINYMQLAMTGGVVIAIPVVFWQLWAFVSPGLYDREKRYIVPFVVFSTLLFLSGVAFAYYVAFPFSFRYFLSLLGRVGDVELTTIPTLEFYIDFTTRMLLAFGFVFELPLFIAFLAIAGIVTPPQLLRFSRYAVVGSFIVGAFVTPGPEVSSQVAVSGALTVLYFLSVVVAYVVTKKPRAEAGDRAPSSPPADRPTPDASPPPAGRSDE